MTLFRNAGRTGTLLLPLVLLIPSAPLAKSASPITIDFAGPAGAPPDPKIWHTEVGGDGWGNGEVQTYTADAANAHLDGSGHLVITARHERRTGPDGITRDYTSARLTTEGTVTVASGSYVEASITAPTGSALWPAFWLAGADFAQVGWPASGELDVLEGAGARASVVHSAVHMAASGDANEMRQFGWDHPGATTDIGTPLDRSPHLYGVYFDARVARFYVDRRPTLTVTAQQAAAAGDAWPFGRSQHILLNVAVAGDQPPADDFPKSMTVGYVKIWKEGIPF